MKSFETRIHIEAPAERVWAILTNAREWTSWNTTVDKVEGDIVLGGTVKVFAKVSPGRAFPVKVRELVANERMVWSSGMPLGLFKGERTFTLSGSGSGVDFEMREAFTGLFAPLITRSIPDLQPAFDEMAAALKRRAEQPV